MEVVSDDSLNEPKPASPPIQRKLQKEKRKHKEDNVSRSPLSLSSQFGTFVKLFAAGASVNTPPISPIDSRSRDKEEHESTEDAIKSAESAFKNLSPVPEEYNTSPEKHRHSHKSPSPVPTSKHHHQKHHYSGLTTKIKEVLFPFTFFFFFSFNLSSNGLFFFSNKICELTEENKSLKSSLSEKERLLGVYEDIMRRNTQVSFRVAVIFTLVACKNGRHRCCKTLCSSRAKT